MVSQSILLNKEVTHTVIIPRNLLRTSIAWRYLRSFKKSTYSGKNRVKRRRVKTYKNNILVKFIINLKFLSNYIISLFFKSFDTLI